MIHSDDSAIRVLSNLIVIRRDADRGIQTAAQDRVKQLRDPRVYVSR